MKIIYRPCLSLHKHNGELLGGPFSIKEGIDHIPTPVSRPKLIGMLYDYVVQLGIPVTFGKRAGDYFEDLDRNRAGIITEEGERLEADLVVAADGVGSKSWRAVSGQDTEPKSSGFSVYRVAYRTKLAFESPNVSKNFVLEEGGDDICRVWLGKNTHAIVLVSPDTTTWFLTHKVSFITVPSSLARWARWLTTIKICRTRAVPQNLGRGSLTHPTLSPDLILGSSGMRHCWKS